MIKYNDIEAHPIGVSKVVKGDILDRYDLTNGAYLGNGGGQVLYDITDRVERPWFVLAYEKEKGLTLNNNKH